jgi:eukaryotic-like serine/threonine-protein kinase
MALTTGMKLGPYEIQSLLGAGGMGEVYLARDTRLLRTVAIKVLPAHLSSDPDLHRRFEQEAKSISALQHPNICVVHDIGRQDGVDFMVMEYVAGQTLDKLIPSGGLATDLAIKYAVQIADALARAHAAGIVHRDLKPANIMVDEAGLVKVLDFGLAKLTAPASALGDDGATMAAGPTTLGMIVGTLAYMSPEQAEGKNLDARSDVFSFGSVLYEMLTGSRPFEAQSSAALLAAVMRDDPKPLNEVRRDVPPEVRRIVTRCLKKDPAARYASGAELAHELKNCRDLLFPESGVQLSPARIAREADVLACCFHFCWWSSCWAAGSRGWSSAPVTRAGHAMWPCRKSRSWPIRGEFADAYVLATRAEKLIPGDPQLEKLWPVISYQISLDSAPLGADVYRQKLRRCKCALGIGGTDSTQESSATAWDVCLEV